MKTINNTKRGRIVALMAAVLLSATMQSLDYAWSQVAASASLQFPDGFANLVPVAQRISLNSPFTVPAGQNFYITQIGDFSPTCGQFTSCALTAGNGSSLLFNVGQFNGPLIIGSGMVVASTGSIHTLDIYGFLVPATVTAVVQDLSPGDSYTVPAGQNFYLTNVGTQASIPFPIRLAIGGMNVRFFSNMAPLIVSSGRVITNSSVAKITMDGYLK